MSEGVEATPSGSKRNSGLFAFFKWLKNPGSASRESVVSSSSSSSSSLTSSAESLSSTDSIDSTGTIASFSFVHPEAYDEERRAKRCVAEEPETDTYRARLKQREKNREKDKDITLRRKYNLFFSKNTILKESAKEEEDNSKSLPLMTKKEDPERQLHRRTASESSKIRKAGSYCHVKGKRKAPPPPPNKEDSLRGKKRLAPPPPPPTPTPQIPKSQQQQQQQQKEEVICNDSLRLDRGILKAAKTETSTRLGSTERSSHVSPRPWYKRNAPAANTSKKELNLDETKIAEVKRKEERRKSGMSFLANISELDREAGELMKKRDGEVPSFARRDRNMEVSPKRKSARDLIAKFNAITGVSKVTVNPFQREKRDQLISKKVPKAEVNPPNPLMKSESATAVKTPTKEEAKEPQKMDRKPWNCPKCRLENDYWRIICKVCSTIKPYFDEFTPRAEKTPINEDPQRIMNLERSKTQIGFSALKEKKIEPKPNQENEETKKEEREKLIKMLIEMKNSLPKRKLNSKENKRTSIIEEGLEALENETKAKEEASKSVQNSDSKAKVAKGEVKREFFRAKTQIALVSTNLKIPQRAKEVKSAKDENGPKILAKENNQKEPKNDIKNTKQTEEEKKSVQKLEDTRKSPQKEPQKTIAQIESNIITQQKKLGTGTDRKELERKNDPKCSKENVQKEPLKENHREELHKENLKQIDQNEIRKSIDPKEIGTENKNEPKTISQNNQKEANLQKTDQNEEKHLILVTQKTIYENIKIPNDASPKSKVSTSAQTSASVVKKTPQVISAPADKIEKTNVEEKQPEERLYANWGEATAGAAAKDGMAVFVNIPKRLNDLKDDFRSSLAQNNADTLEINRLLRRLETAIAKGELTDAAVFARELAHLKVNCSVVRQKDNAEARPKKGTEITVNMFVEDRLSHRGPFPIHVLPDQTVGELKKQVEKDFEIPANVQRWILGKELAVDDKSTLRDLHVTTNGCPVFLYLVAPNRDSKQLDVKTKVDVTQTQSEVKIEIRETENAQKKEVSAQPSTSGQQTRSAPTITEVIEVKVEASKSTNRDSLNLDEEYDCRTLRPQNPKEWECSTCTLLNPISSNICAVCSAIRPPKAAKRKAPQPSRKTEAKALHLQLLDLDNGDLVGNAEAFECVICLTDIRRGDGVTLRECLHQFCKQCLAYTVEFADEAEVKCPYRDDQYSCDIALQDREIKALVKPDIYEQYLARSVKEVENKIEKSFHCKTPDCKGWCIFEDNVNEFRCPVCLKMNCLTCQAIHSGMNCKQYQEKMNAESGIDEDAKRTREMLEEMVNKGEALTCPACQVILMKKWGCDWVRCSMCKTEICWVTRGPRWGPAGKGDTSGGCKCGVNGVKCHAQCNYCH